MIRKDLPATGWTKSSYSEGGNAQCVETLPVGATELAVRDSKAPEKGAFVFPVSSWTTFVSAVKSYELPSA
ncbi:DUF397 domain-containing protein [Streptomyces sp. NPDC045431]|uniref:DUF397 domain-containing protein n=1 Tax=Streptomyces sp. NPDC045431 TaxID=3155613 RepID=UPI0033FE9C35